MSSIMRVEKTKDYTVMCNYHLKEKEMSLKAKGLLSFMLSLPDNWNYTIAGLVSICKENETAIKSALDELKEFGYLEIIKKFPNETQTGRIEYEYIVYEKPKKNKNQGVENLWVGNQGQLNTKELNTKYNKKEIYKEKDNSLSKSIDYDPFVDIFNRECLKLPKIRTLTDKRKTKIKTFLKTFSLNDWSEICKIANANNFLSGTNDRGWKADFDWLSKETRDKFIDCTSLENCSVRLLLTKYIDLLISKNVKISNYDFEICLNKLKKMTTKVVEKYAIISKTLENDSIKFLAITQNDLEKYKCPPVDIVF